MYVHSNNFRLALYRSQANYEVQDQSKKLVNTRYIYYIIYKIQKFGGVANHEKTAWGIRQRCHVINGTSIAWVIFARGEADYQVLLFYYINIPAAIETRRRMDKTWISKFNPFRLIVAAQQRRSLTFNNFRAKRLSRSGTVITRDQKSNILGMNNKLLRSILCRAART